MPIIMNCLDEENSVTVGGARFTFTPKQIKHFHNPDITKFIDSVKGEQGFVALPEELEYLSHLRKGESIEAVIEPDHKPLFEAKRTEGLERYIRKLRELVYNAQVSIKKDIDMKGLKVDPKMFASDGDLLNMKQLVKYQTRKADSDQIRIDQMKELEKKLV